MKYTVVIPSRNRQAYCVSAIKSIIQAKRIDVEVIVLDNSVDKDLLPSLIKTENFGKKVRLIQSEKQCLSMTDNWERAIDFISGKWVMYLGDDDGCTQFTFDAFDFLISTFNFLAFRWPLFTYKWPCFPGSDRGNLKLPLTVRELNFFNSIDVLQEQSSWRGAFRWPSIGPSVYHGLVSTEIIRQGRNKYGKHFIGDSPDYGSGILNTTLLDGYMRYSFPLTIMGASGYSNSAGLTGNELKQSGKSQTEEWMHLKPVFDQILKGTKLAVPFVAHDFKVVFDKLGLDFKLTPKQFLDSCINDLDGLRSRNLFESEKVRLLAYAKKLGLNYEQLLSKTYQRFDTSLGPQGKGRRHYLTVNASSLGYEGIESISELLPKIYTDYNWHKKNETEVLKNAMLREKLSA